MLVTHKMIRKRFDETVHSFRPFIRTKRLYIQGQSPQPRVREYFYFVDQHGQLFLDDARTKNFTSCFKDSAFLEFFFSHLRVNATGRYESEFPYWSPCGRERNFIRCEDRPIVFLDLIHSPSDNVWGLTYGFAKSQKLFILFQPQHLYVSPDSGRIYHPTVDLDSAYHTTFDRSLLTGLVCSSLGLHLAERFVFSETHRDCLPEYFIWNESRYKLSGALSHFIKG